MRFKKKIFCKTIAVVMCALMVLSLFSCGKKGLEKIKESLNNYVIDATLNAENMTLSASEKVSYINNTDVELGEVWFHLYPSAYRDGATFKPVEQSEIGEAYPNGVSYGGINILEVKVGGNVVTHEIGGEDSDILIVPLGKAIMPTERADIGISYNLKLPNMRHRLGYYGKTVNLGNWYPVACVYSGGQFDASPYYSSGDPFNLDVANFSVSISAPKKYIAATSGKSSREEFPSSATTKSSVIAARDFAIVLGEYMVLEGKAGGTKVSYYYYNDTNAAKSLKTAMDAINTFSLKFGEYPYQSYSVCQTAFNQGGMEYTGLVYISDAEKNELYREVIVHETAHQWWYGLVGNDQIKNAWLDEALAEFSTTLFYDENPGYNVKYSDRMRDAMGAYVLYCDVNNITDSSMNRAVNEYKNNNEYTFMTYLKGQIMMCAVTEAIGKPALYAGLKNYCKQYSYTLATPDCLIACLENSSKKELKSFFDSYLDGKALIFGGFH